MNPEQQKEADEKALAEKKKAEETAAAASKPIEIIGGPGNFSITGPGLGTSGRLFIGDTEIDTTRWEDRTVRGSIPAGVTGEVVLKIENGPVRKGGMYKRV